ncbi:MAG: 5-formyltetrahydrofolate cyclo-ligase [Oscillospiraceae bacterium]|nr:5-formyltetrahydrofolate cyclo-ligase [Oscillospiraceae bacterium]
MFELRRQKNEIRNGLLEKRREIPEQKREEWDRKISDIFLRSISYRFCDILLIYASAKDEISTRAIIDHALSNKKIVACPISNTEDNTLTFRTVNSPDELFSGAYNISEPPAENPDFREFLEPGRIDGKKSPLAICVIPCLSYDPGGYRMGYGKGYYDRFLPSFEGTKIGLCYSEFKEDRLPKGKYDVKLDVVITEKGVTVL